MREQRAGLVALTEIRQPGRGAMAIAEVGPQIPFPVLRVFHHWDLAVDEVRGNHAHRELSEFVVCVAGVLDVETEDERGKQVFRLDTPAAGVYLPPMTWIRVIAREAGTICAVMASDIYDDGDYIRDHALFGRLLQAVPE